MGKVKDWKNIFGAAERNLFFRARMSFEKRRRRLFAAPWREENGRYKYKKAKISGAAEDEKRTLWREESEKEKALRMAKKMSERGEAARRSAVSALAAALLKRLDEGRRIEAATLFRRLEEGRGFGAEQFKMLEEGKGIGAAELLERLKERQRIEAALFERNEEWRSFDAAAPIKRNDEERSFGTALFERDEKGRSFGTAVKKDAETGSVKRSLEEREPGQLRGRAESVRAWRAQLLREREREKDEKRRGGSEALSEKRENAIKEAARKKAAEKRRSAYVEEGGGDTEKITLTGELRELMLSFDKREHTEEAREMKIELTNNNTVTNAADMDEITDMLTERLVEMMKSGTDGLYL